MSAFDGRARLTHSMSADCGESDRLHHVLAVHRRRGGAQMNAEKKAQENSGLKTLKLNRSSLRELAKCLGGTRLDGLRGRKRNFLSQRCKLLGLLGQRFELLA